MTKAERLMYLVNMIRNRGAVLVSEMANECGVTPRTIYRDMNSLTRLNFPLYYQHGYRLARDTGFPYAGPDAEDMEFICYSLRNNPLSKHPYFKRRFRVVEQKIRATTGTVRGAARATFFVFDKTYDPIQDNRESGIIARFLKAIQERRKIILTSVDGDFGDGIYIPLAVKLKQSKPYLLVAKGAGLIVEEPTRNITTIKLTNAKFIYRPLDLLSQDLSGKKKVDDM